MFKRKKKEKLAKGYKEVTFVARDKFLLEVSEAPKPAKLFIPDWYKNLPTHQTKQPQFDDMHGNGNSTMKQCMPFFDGFNMGYIMTTPCDIYVEKGFDGETVKISSHKMFDVVGARGPASKTSMPIPDEYYNQEFTWITTFEASTPEGYSSFCMHPINRPDLPFHTITGIMDTDKWYITGNHPFFIKKGFEGVIPMGTPMMQIIPFKRDEWRATEPRAMDHLEHDILQAKVRRHFNGGYKKEAWSKKVYI